MPSATRPRVLLAEDHPGVVQAFVRMLALECDVVEVVTDGTAVAGAALRLHPVVTVVDVNLPGINGLDVCRQITLANPGAKVIVITGMPDEAMAERARAAGASAFMSKFAAGDGLVATVKSVWAGSEA